MTSDPVRLIAERWRGQMTRRRMARKVVLRGVAGLAAFALASGCGNGGDSTTTSQPAPAAPSALRGEAARAAGAVGALERALRDGNVESLCRPKAIFTSAVVAEMNQGGGGCEAFVELSGVVDNPPALTVTKLEHEKDLATARVRIGGGSTIPLDIVRSGRRWLVSFSDGLNPIGVVDQALG